MDPWLIARADYYEDLTISSSASIRVIQAAYRVMAQDHHPDSGSNPDAERMMRINIAYDVLSDLARSSVTISCTECISSDLAKSRRHLRRLLLHGPVMHRHRAHRSVGRPISTPRGAWTDVWSFGVLLIGIFSVLVAVMIMLLT
jgi:hypothetical protein